jgi:PKD repeat protein
VVDNDGTFTTDLSGTLNPIINFTEYGTYTVTQACNFGVTIGTESTTKTDYVKVGVNGTFCSGGGTCSAGGMAQTDWVPVAVVLAFVPIWVLILFASGKR